MLTLNLFGPEWRDCLAHWQALATAGGWLMGAAAPVVLGLLFKRKGNGQKIDPPAASASQGEKNGAPGGGRSGQHGAARSILGGLQASEPNVRAKAAKALGEARDPFAVEPLMMALRDEHRNVRFWAAWGLGVLKDLRAAPALVMALKDPDTGVRYRAAEALGEIKAPEAVGPLTEALQDSGEGVCQVAAWALKQIQASMEAAASEAPPAPTCPVAAPVAPASAAPAAMVPKSPTVIPAMPQAEAAQRAPEVSEPAPAPPPILDRTKVPAAAWVKAAPRPAPPHELPLSPPTPEQAAALQEARAHCIMGQAYGVVGQWDEALNSFQKAVRLAPNLVEALCNLGVAYCQADRLEEGVFFLKQALHQQPDLVEARRNLGLVFGRLGRWLDAVTILQQAARMGINGEVQYNLGVIYGQLGRWQEAAEAFELARRHKPQDPFAACNLGISLGHLGQWQEAAEAFQASLAQQPDDPLARCNLGVALGYLDLWQEALEAFGQVLALNPDDADAQYNLGVVSSLLGQWPEAIEAFKIVLQLNPDDAEAHLQLGQLHQRLGRWREASEAFQQAVLMFEPQLSRASGQLAAINEAGWQEMVEALKQAIRLQPNLTEARYHLGLAYARQGRWQDAAQTFKVLFRLKLGGLRGRPAGLAGEGPGEEWEPLTVSLRLKAELATTHYNLVLAAADPLGAMEELDALEHAVQSQAQDVAAQYRLGRAYMGQGRYPEAAAAFRQVVQLDPQHAMALYYLALACRHLGDLVASLEAYLALKAMDERLAGQLGF
jgi:superkiller protein 3